MATCRSKIQETYTRTGSSSVLRTITYQYNANNELTKVTDTHSGSTVRYYYNSAGQITGQYTTHGTDSHSFHYLYDDLGRLVTLEENVGAELYATEYEYDGASRVSKVTDNLSAATYTYDDYSRLDRFTVKFHDEDAIAITATIYYDDDIYNAYTSDQVRTWSWSNTADNFSYSYTYDNNGNIVSETVNGKTTTYVYDSANQLIRENNQAADKTWVWEYNGAGNIVSKTEFPYTLGEVSGDPTVIYTYGNANWGDLLTAYDGKGIAYDAVGNPTYDGTWNYTWKYGRQLVSMIKTGATWNFTYDANGMRTKRTNGSVTYTYLYNGSQLTQMTRGSVVMRFSYGTDGRPLVISYNDTPYYYITNLQGDVVAIVNSSGTTVVKYTYDAWGRLISTDDDTNINLGEINPLRYRGYVYDQETGLYYLQSRYYDPEMGRWISLEPNVYAGAFDSASGLIGYNVYAYCANNPVNFSDPTGEFILTALIVGVVAGAVIGGAIGGTVAYNSAKSSGLGGSDLFLATVSGFGKGALIGGIAGGLVGATGGVVAAYGATSVAGTAMITATATITAKATEVTALQAKKSANDGDNGWQIANDCIDSVFSNGGKIISPALTKAGTTSATYVANDLIQHKVVPLGFNAFLHSTGGKVLPYGFAAYAWGQTAYSFFCTDPIARANQRGYCLR